MLDRLLRARQSLVHARSGEARGTTVDSFQLLAASLGSFIFARQGHGGQESTVDSEKRKSPNVQCTMLIVCGCGYRRGNTHVEAGYGL